MENESCRILTIASTIKGAVAFIESVKSLAASRSASSASASSSVDKLSVPLTVPWTIRNRYYVADVHFSAWTVDRLFPDVFDRQPPALVFVWYEGEPYVKYVKEIARLMKLREYEPDVALAVRIPGTHSPPEMETDETSGEDYQNENENGDIDSMLMSYGFEYVDATRPLAPGDENGTEDDIPALPRVVDALSTIIWPSMRSNKAEPGVSGPKASLDWNQSFDEIDSEDEDLEKEKESMIQELLDETKVNELSLSPFSSADDGDQELMEQMKAMVLDAEKRRQWERPWVSVSASSSTTGTVSEMAMSPTEIGYGGKEFDRHLDLKLTDEQRAAKGKLSLRFEDDFSVFVSAPAQEGEEKTASLDSTGFLAPDTGFRYRTLGSVSDFGESDDGREESSYARLDDEDATEDDGMPSKKEIRDTAHKIFGGAPSNVNAEDGGAFDLEQVFGVLQEYKTEIAGMENEEAKRKSAARVALGLVYGLEGRI